MKPATVRPIGVYVLSGLAVASREKGDSRSEGAHQRLLGVDTLRGYLVEIDPQTNNTTILNTHQIADWIGATGLSIWEDTIWFTQGQSVFRCRFDGDTLAPLTPTLFSKLIYPADAVAVWNNDVYITCQKSGYIHIFDKEKQECVGKFPQPGVGIEGISATEDSLWVCDRTEQSVYCLERETGTVKFSAITPFTSPTGITLYSPPGRQEPVCYVAYSAEEAYIRDDPNASNPYQLTFRDRTFIHPLYIHHDKAENYTLSNGYLAEISYVEELLPLDDVPALSNVEWRIALPADTHRQKVRSVEAVGHPFTEEIQDGQRVAVYKFNELKPTQAGLVGWKATVEMYSIKYNLTPQDVTAVSGLSEDLKQRYLVDDDELAMDSDIIRNAAKEAAGTETNLLRKALRIRNYVYDHLSYGIQPKIDTPDVALKRGVGSCGEYVGVILALFRLNGIACRTIGRYKCPQTPELRNLPLEPDFNHVWIEFYIPDIGWLPMESNVDDVVDRGPYPNRFFMGLAWYHTELGKGIPFGKLKADNRPEKFSLSNLAINHIRFTLLDELDPSASQ